MPPSSTGNMVSEWLQNYFFLWLVFNSFARKGKLLFWYLPKLHLYSFTKSLFSLVLAWVPTFWNIGCSLFRFFAAIFELMFKHNSPTKVIINEYVKTSEFFLEKAQIKFVNAILDKIAKNIRKTN